MWKFVIYVSRILFGIFVVIIVVMAMTPNEDVDGGPPMLVTTAIFFWNLSSTEEALEIAVALDTATTTGVFTVEKKALTRCLRIATSAKIMNEGQILEVIDNCVASLPTVDPDAGLPE